MDKHELAKRLMATFLEELHEHVDSMNRDLLVLEKNPSGDDCAELLKTLFRAAHSVKGAARAVNVEPIADVCHVLEDIFCALRDGGCEPTAELFSLMFKTVDGIEEVGMRLRDEQDLSDAPVFDLIPLLQEAAEGEVPAVDLATETDDEVPAPEMPNEPETVTPDMTEATDETNKTESDKGVAAVAQTSAPAAPTPAPAVTTSTGPATIRVAAEKLDGLLAQSGELLVARRRVEFRSTDAVALRDSLSRLRTEWTDLEKPLRKLLGGADRVDISGNDQWAKLPRRAAGVFEQMSGVVKQLEKDADGLHSNMVADGRLLGQTCDALDDEVHHVRMLPFAEACGGLERAVRDLAQSTGKTVVLEILGEDVEVDRSVLEGLKDPLIHLVRNAIDHGLEMPDERAVAGKAAEGRITVSAELRGGQVEVVIEDDGCGFNLERIREKAKSKGWAIPDDERELARLVFAPGFSTAPIVTDVSGRGVGLDVVQTQIESLHGGVDVTSGPNAGTRFTLTVPLTLTTIRCLTAVVGDQTFAIPTSTVEQIVRFGADNVGSVGGREMLLLGGSPIPLASLSDTLGKRQLKPLGRDSKILAIILSAGEQSTAFVVDELKTEQEVLIKNLGARIRRARHFSGATLLPSGRIALVLNVPNVVRTALGSTTHSNVIATEGEKTVKTRTRLLVVDDSVTTRTLMKSILETANYNVTAAVDGQHAWECMQNDSFDLVVSDVEMPRMDGFELTSSIRGVATFNELPVILVTARGTDEDKARGIQVGANAYLVKSSFDQRNLLETIEQLI